MRESRRAGIPAARLYRGVARRPHHRALAQQGTLIAVAVLAVTVALPNQLGAPFFVEPLFNGLMLTIAVGLSVSAARRRERIATEK